MSPARTLTHGTRYALVLALFPASCKWSEQVSSCAQHRELNPANLHERCGTCVRLCPGGLPDWDEFCALWPVDSGNRLIRADGKMYLMMKNAVLASEDGGRYWDCARDLPRQCHDHAQVVDGWTLFCWSARTPYTPPCSPSTDIFDGVLSIDGGASWQAIDVPGEIHEDTWFTSSATGYALSEVLKPGLPAGSDTWPLCLEEIDAIDRGRLETVLFQTNDGGATWHGWTGPEPERQAIVEGHECRWASWDFKDWPGSPGSGIR